VTRRIDSEAFFTPELDASICASVCPPGGVIASRSGVGTYWDRESRCFSHPLRDAELRAERRAALKERAFAARSARMAQLESQPWFPEWKAAKIASGQWVDFGSGEVVGR